MKIPWRTQKDYPPKERGSKMVISHKYDFIGELIYYAPWEDGQGKIKGHTFENDDGCFEIPAADVDFWIPMDELAEILKQSTKEMN